MGKRITRRRLIYGAITVLGIGLIVTELYILSPSVRTLAVSGAEEVGADEFLAARLEDRDHHVRTAAGDALVRRGTNAVPALVALLNDPAPGNRRIAAATLANMGPVAVDALPALQRVAEDDADEGVQEKAGMALGRIARGNAELVDRFLAALDAPADAKRLAAIRAAAWLNDPRAIGPLQTALKHANPKVREEAAEALGDLKGLSAAAVPALLGLLNDPSETVKSEARSAIAKIVAAAASSIDPKVLAEARKAVEISFKPVSPPAKVDGE